MVTWPAIIKFSGDDQLGYIANLEQWNADQDLNFLGYQSTDILIDSRGVIHHLSHLEAGTFKPQSTDELIELHRAIVIVQAHFSATGSCCAAKISARSVAQLIELVGIDN